MRVLLLTCALLALAACHKSAQHPANEASPTAQGVPHKGVDRSHKGKPIPDVTFKDPDGGDTDLSQLDDRPILLVNLWATWCAPCVKELPTLQKLQAANAGIRVLPVSQDMGPQPSVEAFLASKKLDFEPYQDPKMAMSGALDAEVLPTTILYANGKEVWRYVGDLDWTSPEAARLLAEGGAAKAR